MWRRLWLGSALALISHSAQAADAQGRYAAHGLGRIECKRFVEVCEKGSDDCRLTGTWISGYLTAFNALNKDTFDVLPWQAPELVAEGAYNLCTRNPDAALVETVTEVVRVLLPQRIDTAAERVKIGEGRGAVFLYRDTVRQMQQRLIEAGQLKGGADGAYGPGTKAALESFQKAAGLEATGLPDQRTLVALFYGGARQPGQEGRAPQANAAPRAAAPRAPTAGAAARPGDPAAPQLDLNLTPRSP